MYHRIGVVGLGYVGVTLAAALADKGYEVHGVDTQPAVREALAAGRPHLFEPGIEEVLRRRIGRTLHVAEHLPADLDAVVLCVSTPVDPAGHRARLENLAAAAEAVAAHCDPRTLVVVRSTVPVGTSRAVVLPPLLAAWGDDVRLVMAPERTIQGQALRELVELPQVVGGRDAASLEAGLEFFAGLARQLVPVSGLEAAELVKLANNCHTDLIYSYGNEVALIAETHRLDPLEVIRAANLDYPRPDLSRPGYVGGGCLSKDPYLLMESAGDRPPFLVGAARRLNEHLPVHVAERVLHLLRQDRGELRGVRLAVLGWAYKGWPATDDMRGTPVTTMLPVFAAAGLTVLGHDPMVTDEVIARHGGQPTSLDKAFAEADAVLVLNDHPDYRALPVGTLLPGTPVRLVFDSWRIFDEAAVRSAGVRYAGIGYLPADGVPPAPRPAGRPAPSATVPA
ncbi:nucleotide sugar dehydrogenase [Micromonospora mirobrigensis]|uniref:UDP-N-acetyl-D-mannosaminuronic acid dehydrogenase n=1 Tax=Micromonospora mirobrigensis TaxID=262898 RepID=A0A1C4Z8Y5_9ACTN|nr:nucleotide sugar dehydrogenase [Micromonospora mirobrigensis]SCF29378.1 UDP-N-acetyl-D-mannosaminuronic acid dehydrogenase [Micromonospora mirobrigensis]